ncbi:D-glycerate dehydrogenase [Candidatus Bathyarchaeota archaeon]|nr:MAG: D-glycerate dehydrogenase [Candidatus Bathyarchaeota archaeon]
MSEIKVYVTRSLLPPYLEILKEICTPEIWSGNNPPPRKILLEKVKEKDGLLCLLTEKIDKELMENGKDLVVISTMSVGFEHIDIKEATERGIYICNTPGVLTEAVADHTLALLLATARRMIEADLFIRGKKWTMPWSPTMLLGASVYGKTLGLIGLGRIGQAVAKRASGFNMKVIYYDVDRQNPDVENDLNVKYYEFDEVLKESDFISIHVPSTKETHHLIGDRELDLMKPESFFINTARGAIVDEKALFKALKEKKIQGAGIDVWEKEPTNLNNPLFKLDNTVLTPHIASATVESRTMMAKLSAKNLVAVLKGEMPISLVNKDVLKVRPLSKVKRV